MAPTIQLTVNYLRPVPLGQKLTAIGWEVRKKGREHLRVAEIRNEAGEVLSAGKGTFLEIHAEGMMKKFFRAKKTSE